VKDELYLALTDLEETLANSSPNDVGAIRLDQEGKLVIPPQSAEDIPAEAKALRDELASMLPFVPSAPTGTGPSAMKNLGYSQDKPETRSWRFSPCSAGVQVIEPSDRPRSRHALQRRLVL